MFYDLDPAFPPNNEKAGDSLMTRKIPTHSSTVQRLVDARRTKDITPLDEAEAGQLLSVAAALDADRANVALMREFRIALKEFRRNAEAARDGAGLAEFLTDALAEEATE